VTDPFVALGPEQRALVLTLALRAGDASERVLGRLAAPADCLSAARALAALPRQARVERLAAEARRTLLPLVPGMAAIHPSWIDEALAGEPAYIVRAVRHAEGPAKWVAELRRHLLGHLCAMPVAPPPLPSQWQPHDLPLLSAERLQAILSRIGVRHLARAFAGVGPEAVAQLTRRLGPAGGQALADASALGPYPRDQAKAAIAALATLAREAGTPGELVLGAAAHRLGGGELCRQIAQRLPLPIGRRLLAEADRAPDPDLVAELRALL
jgi:hypothetical protein